MRTSAGGQSQIDTQRASQKHFLPPRTNGPVCHNGTGGPVWTEIVSAVDGPITAGDFGEPHTNGACDHEGQCVLLAIWAASGAHMRRYLGSYTLANIASISRGDRVWPTVEPE